MKQKFLGEICAPEKETYFYVGTVLKWPKSWVVIGAFLPEVRQVREPDRADRRTVHPIGMTRIERMGVQAAHELVSTRPPARLPVLSDHRPNRLPPGHSGSIPLVMLVLTTPPA